MRISLDDPCDFLDWRFSSGGSIEITEICVGTERRKGHGRVLIRKLLEEAEHRTQLVFAMTRKSNEIARQFYTGVGFELLGVLYHFYTDTNESAYVYGVRLQ